MLHHDCVARLARGAPRRDTDAAPIARIPPERKRDAAGPRSGPSADHRTIRLAESSRRRVPLQLPVDIGAERDKAIADLRREAVDLALAGASKVIERNLDEAGNRKLIESFLATIPSAPSRR